MLAVKRESEEAVSLLLAHKAEVNKSGDVSNLHHCKLITLVCITLFIILFIILFLGFYNTSIGGQYKGFQRSGFTVVGV
jgi:uncharacterized membrane protein YiaA